MVGKKKEGVRQVGKKEGKGRQIRGKDEVVRFLSDERGRSTRTAVEESEKVEGQRSIRKGHQSTRLVIDLSEKGYKVVRSEKVI